MTKIFIVAKCGRCKEDSELAIDEETLNELNLAMFEKQKEERELGLNK